MRYAGFLVALSLAGCAPAAAGQIQVDIRPPDAAASLLSLTSDDLKLTPSGAHGYAFVFKSPSLYDGKLIVAIEKPPAGYDPFHMELDLPFFAEQSLSMLVAGAIANDPLTDTGAANFVRGIGVGPGPGAIAENVLIHERARRYWAQRSSDLAAGVHAANLDDVGVAYWLLYTTRNLILSSYLNPDEITANAVGFFKAKLADPAEASRLFPPNFVSKQVAKYLVDSIEARDSYFYSSIVNKLEGRLSSGDYAICDKVRSLAQQVMQMPDYQLAQFNGEYPTTIKSKADAIACLSHDLIALAGKPLSPDQSQAVADAVGAAADDLNRGAKALAEISSPTGAADPGTVSTFSVAITNLQQRLGDLKVLQAKSAP